METVQTSTQTIPRIDKHTRIRYRTAAPEDGKVLHTLVEDGGILELNSCYSYVLMCDHFAATTMIAEVLGEARGFVTAYRPPSHPDTVFVWQIGVHPSLRGRGVARGLLDALVARPACRGVRYLEATVTPSNTASRRLFQSFARHRGSPCVESGGYPGTIFAEEAHEAERLIRIGPFTSGANALS